MERSSPKFSCRSCSNIGLLSSRLLRGDDRLGLCCKLKTLSATMAVKPHDQDSHHNSEHVLDHMKDAVCTESTVSCGFQSKAASMESKLSYGIDPKAVLTELTLSCGPVQIEAKKRKALEARNSLHRVTFARIHELLFTEDPDHEGVSTEMKLFKESWIDPEKTETLENTREDQGISRRLKLFNESALIDSKNSETVENKHVGGVSTTLKLFDETWNYTDPKKSETVLKNTFINPKEDGPVSDNSGATVSTASNSINAVTARSRSVRLDKDLHAETTPTAMEDPWKIKKALTESDLGNLSRLLLKTTWVRHHVLPFLDTDIIREVESDQGKRVNVWDQDSQSAHELVLKKWKTCKSYVLINKWHKDFVNRRKLKKGDVIGLYWDPFNSIFHFSVLKRADLVADHHHQPNLLTGCLLDKI
ncbi:B3 domain-containing protein At2g33720-like [Carya illinoinensis]|uniref:B3 domain-containing protein At2g33720-like n=1 Tax=Carya illinoinensis TaxID=32201 RepID=UPI001C723482|nr:B3 domain-containing protein At2g33720-like [Carya illinoinensis]